MRKLVSDYFVCREGNKFSVVSFYCVFDLSGVVFNNPRTVDVYEEAEVGIFVFASDVNVDLNIVTNCNYASFVEVDVDALNEVAVIAILASFGEVFFVNDAAVESVFNPFSVGVAVGCIVYGILFSVVVIGETECEAVFSDLGVDSVSSNCVALEEELNAFNLELSNLAIYSGGGVCNLTVNVSVVSNVSNLEFVGPFEVFGGNSDDSVGFNEVDNDVTTFYIIYIEARKDGHIVLFDALSDLISVNSVDVFNFAVLEFDYSVRYGVNLIATELVVGIIIYLTNEELLFDCDLVSIVLVGDVQIFISNEVSNGVCYISIIVKICSLDGVNDIEGGNSEHAEVFGENAALSVIYMTFAELDVGAGSNCFEVTGVEVYNANYEFGRTECVPVFIIGAIVACFEISVVKENNETGLVGVINVGFSIYEYIGLVISVVRVDSVALNIPAVLELAFVYDYGSIGSLFGDFGDDNILVIRLHLNGLAVVIHVAVTVSRDGNIIEVNVISYSVGAFFPVECACEVYIVNVFSFIVGTDCIDSALGEGFLSGIVVEPVVVVTLFPTIVRSDTEGFVFEVRGLVTINEDVAVAGETCVGINNDNCALGLANCLNFYEFAVNSTY